jgi:hypothetical protein
VRLSHLLSSPEPGCRPCRHFADDAWQVEAALPGLSALASAHASTWDAGGLCLHHDRLTNGRRRCPAFAR